MKKWDATGSFWRPEMPEKVYWGRITFTPGEGTRIILEGNLFGEMVRGSSLHVTTVCGRLFNGVLCSTFLCWCNVETYIADREHFRTNVSSHMSVLGGNWANTAACRLDSLQLRLSHFNEWFDVPYDIRHKRGDFQKSLLSFKADDLTADFHFNGVNVELGTLCARSIPICATPAGPAWSYNYYITLRPATGQEIQWFLDLASSLRELFVFLIGSGVFTLDMVGRPEGIDADDPSRVYVDLPVAIPSVVRLESRYFSTLHTKYRDSVPSVVRTWFERRQDLRVATNAYTELLCFDGASPETILLRTVQTLEHLHGLLWENDSNYVAKPTFNRFVQWIWSNFPTALENISPDEMRRLASNKELLINRVRGLNNLSFRSRLEKIFKEIPGTQLMPILGNPQDIDVFLKSFLVQVEASRNFLTHFDEKQRERAFHDKELENAALICWAALTFWIGKVLGFSESQAGNLALSAKEALFLVHPRSAL